MNDYKEVAADFVVKDDQKPTASESFQKDRVQAPVGQTMQFPYVKKLDLQGIHQFSQGVPLTVSSRTSCWNSARPVSNRNSARMKLSSRDCNLRFGDVIRQSMPEGLEQQTEFMKDSFCSMNAAMEQAAQAMEHAKQQRDDALRLANAREEVRQQEISRLRHQLSSLQSQVQKMVGESEVRLRAEELQKNASVLRAKQRDLEGNPLEFEYEVQYEIMNLLPPDKAKRFSDFVERLWQERNLFREDRECLRKDLHVLKKICRSNLIGNEPLSGTSQCIRTREKSSASDSIEVCEIFTERMPMDDSAVKEIRKAVETVLLESAPGAGTECVRLEEPPNSIEGLQCSINFAIEQKCPRLTLRAHSGHADEEDVHVFTKAVDDMLQSRKHDVLRVAVVFDFSEMNLRSHGMLTDIADWCKSKEEAIEETGEQKILAVVIILQDSLWSRALQGMAWAFLMVAPTCCPFSMVWSVEEAEAVLAEECLPFLGAH